MVTIFSNHFKGLRLFCRAFSATKREMWISVQILIIVTLLFAVVMFIAERQVNPDYSYTDALIWTFVKYVEDPAGIVDSPVTLLGQIIGTLVGVLGIAIFAVPAGLIGSGFMEAMAKNRREKDLARYHKKLIRAYSAGPGRQLKQYLEKLPKDENAWYNGCKFGYITTNINIAKFQLKGMELKDILDVCKEYPEFRVKNEASAMSIEEGKEDRYMLEHFPVNRRYGFFVNRGSKVTIVSTSSQSELCTGNFSYYLAKFAGFNYISKDFNAADGESYFNNHWEEPFYEGVTLKERLNKGEKVSKEMRKAYQSKTTLRKEFLSDLESLCQDEDSWVISMLTQVQNQENKVDVHVAHALADGSCSTILTDQDKYKELLFSLKKNMQEELQLTVEETTRYPLIKRGSYRNLAYKLHDDGCKCNVLSMRVSSHLMEFDVRMRVAQFVLAKTIHDVIEPEHRLLQNEVEDMNRTSRFYGFVDQEIDRVKETLFESE